MVVKKGKGQTMGSDHCPELEGTTWIVITERMNGGDARLLRQARPRSQEAGRFPNVP
jgi:hypothetical protein